MRCSKSVLLKYELRVQKYKTFLKMKSMLLSNAKNVFKYEKCVFSNTNNVLFLNTKNVLFLIR